MRDFDTNKLRDFSDLLSFKIYLLDYFVIIFFIKVTNVESLLSENMISKLRKALSQAEVGNFAMFLIILIGDLVGALCAQPLICPLI